MASESVGLRRQQVIMLLKKRVLASDANRTEEFHFTRQQVEYAKLRAAGLSLAEIARKTGKHREDVSKSLSRFSKIYPEIYRIVGELQRSKFLYRQRDFKEISRAFQEHSLQKVKQGYHVGPAPFGFKKENGLLIPIPQEAEVVSKLFIDRDHGKSFDKISQTTGLSKTQLLHISRNPVYKKQQPLVRWGQDYYPAKHQGFIDDELWDRVQTSHRPRGAGMPPFGFKWISGHLKPDPEKRETIRNIFKWWLTGVHQAEIARRVNVDDGVVRRTLRNPLCWRTGIVSQETWKSAQKIKHTALETVKRLKTKRKTAHRKRIVQRLAQGDATVVEIAESTGLPISTVRFWLHDLKGLVEKRRSGKLHVWSLARELRRAI